MTSPANPTSAFTKTTPPAHPRRSGGASTATSSRFLSAMVKPGVLTKVVSNKLAIARRVHGVVEDLHNATVGDFEMQMERLDNMNKEAALDMELEWLVFEYRAIKETAGNLVKQAEAKLKGNNKLVDAKSKMKPAKSDSKKKALDFPSHPSRGLEAVGAKPSRRSSPVKPTKLAHGGNVHYIN